MASKDPKSFFPDFRKLLTGITAHELHHNFLIAHQGTDGEGHFKDANGNGALLDPEDQLYLLNHWFDEDNDEVFDIYGPDLVLLRELKGSDYEILLSDSISAFPDQGYLRIGAIASDNNCAH